MKFNQSKFAKAVGCSQQNISKLIKKGILEVGDDKKLDYDNSLDRLRNFDLLDENNKLKKSRTAKEDKPESNDFLLPFNSKVEYKTLADFTPAEREQIDKEEFEAFKQLEDKKNEAKSKNIEFNDDSDDDLDIKEYNYAKAKALREHYMGQIAELDYQIKLGDYVPKVEVEQTFFEATRKVRDMLLNLPNKLSIRVVGKKEPKEIENILMDEIRYICENLSL